MMSRLAVLLLAAVVASALYVVRVQYQSRLLFSEIDHATRDAQQLATDHQRLEVEKRAAATSLRVEQLARDKLTMRSITPAITDYVKQPAHAGGNGAAHAAATAGGAS